MFEWGSCTNRQKVSSWAVDVNRNLLVLNFDGFVQFSFSATWDVAMASTKQLSQISTVLRRWPLEVWELARCTCPTMTHWTRPNRISLMITSQAGEFRRWHKRVRGVWNDRLIGVICLIIPSYSFVIVKDILWLILSTLIIVILSYSCGFLKSIIIMLIWTQIRLTFVFICFATDLSLWTWTIEKGNPQPLYS